MSKDLPALHLIIFSKDRACQLDLLLRSITFRFSYLPSRISILYTWSDEKFQKGYEKLQEKGHISRIEWIRERDFATDLSRLVGQMNREDYVLFLVDDNVFYKPCDISTLLPVFSPKHLFISLRCSRSFVRFKPPVFKTQHPYLEWKWNYAKKDRTKWNYPFSVDGHIFHVAHMQKVLKAIQFKAPNSLEGRMHRYRHAWWVKRIKYAIAPLEACVINNPLNKVQTEGQTWHKDISVAELNTQYLKNYQISLDAFDSIAPDDVHYAVDISFEESHL